jgi:phytoene dehydrogenase-like protein
MSYLDPQVIIVGAGLAGLACARQLQQAGRSFRVIEAADAVGGRIRTDRVDGFQLDRGFQVLLTAYPEVRQVLDLEALKLRPFLRGADVFCNGKFQRLADPIRHPLAALKLLSGRFLPWADQWRMLLLLKEMSRIHSIPTDIPEKETEDYLMENFHFSAVALERFFRPFFGGVFLEKDLRTSSRMFAFLFSMFLREGAAIPAAGIQAIPEQLAQNLPQGSILLNKPVQQVSSGQVTLATGEVLRADHIVLAVDEDAAYQLGVTSERPKPPRSVTCVYFQAAALPARLQQRMLYLDGTGRGPVNNAAVLSAVAPEYAPPGRHLISTSIIGAPSGSDLVECVQQQMQQWFGRCAAEWQPLRTYQIRHAQPEQRQLMLADGPLETRLAPGLYRCGDYVENVTINGALVSGRKAAEAILQAS